MAIRDAGDFGFGMSFEDAVAKGRKENWSDRDLAALLKCTEEEVTRVPREKVLIKLEDLKFRPDTSEGGMIVEYLVDGRKKPQVVPRVVGEVLESVVKEVMDLRAKWSDFNRIAEVERERLAAAFGGNGDGESGPVRRGPRKGKEKANAKARKGT